MQIRRDRRLPVQQSDYIIDFPSEHEREKRAGARFSLFLLDDHTL